MCQKRTLGRPVVTHVHADRGTARSSALRTSATICASVKADVNRSTVSAEQLELVAAGPVAVER